MGMKPRPENPPKPPEFALEFDRWWNLRQHIVEGEFQSDKYPACPRGKVPLSVKDPTAQDLLWEYAQRRRVVDAVFADDLQFALKQAGFMPRPEAFAVVGDLRKDET